MIKTIVKASLLISCLGLTAACSTGERNRITGSGNEILLISDGVRKKIEEDGSVEAAITSRGAQVADVSCRRERKTGSNILIRRCYTRDEGDDYRNHNYMQWQQRNTLRDSHSEGPRGPIN